ncbi:MAG: Flp pilus assembly complex ATPase component TadA [Victivallales bacterium]|nr:Flp pilus assembly complex ATPase component TadA [Victivallales bacterium]
MYEIQIKIPGQPDSTGKLVPGVYRLGSSPASHIQIQRDTVSSRHAQFIVGESSLKVADMGSSNGTILDGRKVGEEPEDASPGSVIQIGDVVIELKGPAATPPPRKDDQQPPPAPKPLSNPAKRMELTSKLEKAVEQAKTMEKSAAAKGNEFKPPVLKISGISAEARPLVQEIKKRAHLELINRLNLKRMAISGTSELELADKARATIHVILSELSIPLPPGVNISTIEQELVHEAIGLGPLEDLICMDDITEIMVNGPNHVYVEKDGVLLRTDTAFADDNQVEAAIERIVSPLGRRIDESSPMVDARLSDGSRVNAVIPPLSLVGPSITIRKFSKTPFKVQDLVSFGTLSENMVKFLDVCVKIRKNIIISGGTGSGKTTLLNVVSSFLPHSERIITIEDAAELQLGQQHIVRLEARPPNIEGKGEVSIRDLVRNSLRMRPDRIVVGECRSGEALDMLQAMNTGHDGSLTTVHANSPRDALARLETLVMMAGFDLPLRAIREQIASAITIVVQVDRHKDGSRKISNISEVTKMEGDIITMQDIFMFNHEGWTPEGKIKGKHVACGNIPTFMEEINRAGMDLDIAIFRDEREGGGYL